MRTLGRFTAMVFAVFALVGLPGLRKAHARQNALPPVIAFAQADGATITPGAGLATVEVDVSDLAGLRCVSLTGANRSLCSYYAQQTRSAVLRLFWVAANYPPGDYTFHCTAVDAFGLRSDRSITLHLVK